MLVNMVHTTATEPAIANSTKQTQKRRLGKHMKKNDNTDIPVIDENEVEQDAVVTVSKIDNKRESAASNEDSDGKESAIDDCRDALESDSESKSAFELCELEMAQVLIIRKLSWFRKMSNTRSKKESIQFNTLKKGKYERYYDFKKITTIWARQKKKNYMFVFTKLFNNHMLSRILKVHRVMGNVTFIA